MIADVTGIVLAGGRSRRFGTDKALVAWQGEPLITQAVAICASLFPETVVAVKRPRRFRFLAAPGVRVVADRHGDHHVLGGIESGLSHVRTSYGFVCACDMPFVQPAVVGTLRRAAEGYDVALPIWGGYPQPLCALYSVGCRGAIRDFLKARDPCLCGLFQRLRTRFLGEEEIRSADPDGISFVDIDTPEDYRRARSLLAMPC